VYNLSPLCFYHHRSFTQKFKLRHHSYQNMSNYFQQWFQKRSYKEVIAVCLPLVLSMSASTVMTFTDRIFLANYSLNAISAALPASITSYLFVAFFGGIGGYAGVFIAQYTGRGNHLRVGKVLWQGIHFTFAAGICLWLLALYGTEPLFSLAGHPQDVQELERIYFTILCKGAVFSVATVTLSTFFTGRGLTRPVMLITFLGVIINIPLDYGLIFGHWGLPELGIRGAAIATVTAWAIEAACLSLLIFTRKNNHRFGVFSEYRFDRRLFARLMRFGVPGSLQFTIDILAFTLFILIIGRIGKLDLAATNIVISINSLAFMPSMGVSQGIGVLVGQALGKKSPKQASEHVWSAIHLLIAYIICVDLLFIFAPEFVLAPFISTQQTTAEQAIVLELCIKLLHVISAYLLFDALYMVFSGALRGAGDTRFMMRAITLVSFFCFVLPVFIGVQFFEMSTVTAWLWVVFFIVMLFCISWWRYRSGIWKKMLVIESEEVS
jgi:MATE family multidrug resistance protein